MPARAATKPAGPRAKFETEDAYKTWRVLSRNPQYTGGTEGIGFSNGQASVPGLPRSVQCRCTSNSRETGEGNCRLHERLDKLNGFLNYPSYERVQNPQTKRFVYQKVDSYRVLTEAEYDAEFGDVQDVIDDILDL